MLLNTIATPHLCCFQSVSCGFVFLDSQTRHLIHQGSFVSLTFHVFSFLKSCQLCLLNMSKQRHYFVFLLLPLTLVSPLTMRHLIPFFSVSALARVPNIGVRLCKHQLIMKLSHKILLMAQYLRDKRTVFKIGNHDLNCFPFPHSFSSTLITTSDQPQRQKVWSLSPFPHWKTHPGCFHCTYCYNIRTQHNHFNMLESHYFLTADGMNLQKRFRRDYGSIGQKALIP